MAMKSNTVIVGGSLAGYNTAVSLRNAGYREPIILVEAENELPYDRPPLSKGFILGTTEEKEIRLCTPEEVEQHELILMRGYRVTGVDLDTRQLQFEDGSQFDFGNLVIATGASPVRMPWHRDLEGVHLLRSLGDARGFRDNLESARKLVVIGGGFIGTEVAASARSLGLEVTVIMREELPLIAAFGRVVGEAIADLHLDRGINFRFNSTVTELLGSTTVTGVRLADDSVIDADLVLIAVGARPEVAWLTGTGLDQRGVPVDDGLRAGDRIWAAGDVVQGEVGHWNSSLIHARRIAADICGEADANSRHSLPDYFWTDQFEAKIQVLGESGSHMEHQPISGSLAAMDYIGVYLLGGRVRGTISVASPRALAQLRKLLITDAPLEKYHESFGTADQPAASTI